MADSNIIDKSSSQIASEDPAENSPLTSHEGADTEVEVSVTSESINDEKVSKKSSEVTPKERSIDTPQIPTTKIITKEQSVEQHNSDSPNSQSSDTLVEPKELEKPPLSSDEKKIKSKNTDSPLNQVVASESISKPSAENSNKPIIKSATLPTSSTPRTTSLYSSKPAPKPASTTGQWTSILKRAVANVESTIDKVIQDSGTSEIGPKPETGPEPEPEPEPKPIESPKPIAEAAPSELIGSTLTGGRLSMKERLALAMKQSPNNTPSRTSTSSPRESFDRSSTPRTSINISRNSFDRSNSPLPDSEKHTEDIETDPDTDLEMIPNSASQPNISLEIPRSQTDTPNSAIFSEQPSKSSFDLAASLAGSNSDILDVLSEEINSLEHKPDDSTKSKLKKLLSELKSRDVSVTEELDSYKEKATSLESKIVFLSREEAARAKNEKLSSSGIQKKLAEKEEQIALLMEEGQLLSKKELKHMNTIKLLRSREKEQERIALDAKDRQERAEREAKRLKDKIKSLQEVEKRQTGDLRALSRLEIEVDNLKKEKLGYLSQIDGLEKTITSLKEKNDEAVLAAQSKALEAEKARSSDLQRELAQVQLELSVTGEKYKSEIKELEARISRDSSAWDTQRTKMDKDIRSLEAKVEMYRGRSEELSSGTSSDSQVTLLRQIEVLQSQHSIATENWNGIESNLQNRITNLEQQLEESNSREAYFRKKVKGLVSENRNIFFHERFSKSVLTNFFVFSGRLKT